MPEIKLAHRTEAVSAAYVHIPFCVRKCSYCDFISYPGQSQASQLAYCEALLAEISWAAAWSERQPGLRARQLQSVFVGGGTPTVLPPEQLARILAGLEHHFGLDTLGEYTLEANPGTVTAAGLRICRQAGFNRISLGLQAIQPQLLKMLGRIHDLADFENSLEMAAAAGFRSVNADIMLGLPGQSVEDVAATLDYLLRKPIDHLSFYSLILEEGTPLQARCTANPALLPDDETERAQYHLVRQTLLQAGFDHYEISNAARPGCRCRHNLVYWQGRPYYGFGVAAHSYIEGIRRSNPTGLGEYLAAWPPAAPEHAPAGDLAVYPAARVEEIVDLAEARKEMMLLGLRLLEGVSYADFYNRFGCDLRECFAVPVSRLVGRGLLQADDQGVRLSSIGLDLANQVFAEFV